MHDVLTLGRSAREHARRVARFLGHGDLDYWPFEDQAELRTARLHVRLLSGAGELGRFARGSVRVHSPRAVGAR